MQHQTTRMTDISFRRGQWLLVARGMLLLPSPSTRNRLSSLISRYSVLWGTSGDRGDSHHYTAGVERGERYLSLQRLPRTAVRIGSNAITSSFSVACGDEGLCGVVQVCFTLAMRVREPFSCCLCSKKGATIGRFLKCRSRVLRAG
jgi:hypothetical protein